MVEESNVPWVALLAVVIGVALILLFFVMQGKIWDAIKEPGKAIIDAINKIVAGRPPWLS